MSKIIREVCRIETLENFNAAVSLNYQRKHKLDRIRGFRFEGHQEDLLEHLLSLESEA